MKEISEKTKVTINLVLLISTVLTLLVGVFGFGRAVEYQDQRIVSIEKDQQALASEQEECAKELRAELAKNALKDEEQDDAINSQNLTLVEIQTNVVWIKAAMQRQGITP